MSEHFQVAGTAVFEYECSRTTMKVLEREIGELLTNRETQQLFTPGDVLRQIIHDCSNDAWKQLGADLSRAQLRPTQVWVNRVLKYGSHRSHYHPNSVLSGILYFDTHDVPTVFRRRTIYAELPVRWWSDHETEWESSEVAAIRGRVIIFPSNLHHLVPYNPGDDRRVVAWNTFPKGTLMEESQLCQLVL